MLTPKEYAIKRRRELARERQRRNRERRTKGEADSVSCEGQKSAGNGLVTKT